MVATGHRNKSASPKGRSAALHSNVLVLNRLYAAVQVVSARRAFCLLCKRTAEVVSLDKETYLMYDFEGWLAVSQLRIAIEERAEQDDWVRAVSFEVQVPRVIRLLGYDRIPHNFVKFSRRNVFLRDENRCQYCGVRFSPHKLSLDHVVPRSRGGLSTWENVVCACLTCNVRKGGRTPQEAGMPLHTIPRCPRRSPVLALQLNSGKYACWKNFLE